MALRPTRKNEIDRKLHRIVLEADADEYDTQIALARYVAGEEAQEFSYETAEGTRSANAGTVSTYVAFAQAIKLLDENMAPTRDKKDVRTIENFQQWLAECVMEHLRTKSASPAQIRRVIDGMLTKRPCELPTAQKLCAALGTSLSVDHLRFSLKIIWLLRSNVVQIRPYRLYFTPDVIRS